MSSWNCRGPNLSRMAIRPVRNECNCLCPSSKTHDYGRFRYKMWENVIPNPRRQGS